MPESKHTPGPWRWEQSYSNGVPGCLELMAGDRTWLATLVGSTQLGLSSRANANLMAAAPDLLSALIAYVEREEQAAPASSSPLRERARDAIKKAGA